jgi:ATP-dependent Clp protease ATP-binding subunit ClpC
LGPTGVGKTELTKALAEFMFNDDKALIRIDMSEFMEKHSVSKLIGAPPGYVGHEEGGTITEMIRHRPYSVVLFDEIEKAHPEVFNILLQVLDNGRLTDAKGRTVNFRNSVVILTSNIGSQHINKMEKIGFAVDKTEKAGYEDAKSKVLEALKDHFRPEFLNRLDDILVFDILSKEAVAQIVKIQVEILKDRLAQKEITLNLSDAVFDHLAKEGYSPQYGARPLKRLLQTKILTPIASLMVGKGVMKGGIISVDIKDGEFVFDVKKGKKGSFIADGIVQENIGVK